MSYIAKIMLKHYENRYGIELSFKKFFFGGVLLLHPYNITVNSRAVLGNNVTLFKGCTIGSVRSGKREGVPYI